MTKGWRREYFKRSEGCSFSHCSKRNIHDLNKIMGPFGKAFHCFVILEALRGNCYLFVCHKLYTSNFINYYIFIIFYCTYHRRIHIHFNGKQMFLHKKIILCDVLNFNVKDKLPLVTKLQKVLLHNDNVHFLKERKEYKSSSHTTGKQLYHKLLIQFIFFKVSKCVI